MSLALVGGKLRKRSSGVDRSQAAFLSWGEGPRKGDWSDLWLDVIMRRLATSDRRMVTAAKWVYSTWQFERQPGEKRHGVTIYWDRPRRQPVQLLPALAERTYLPERMEADR